MKITLWMSISIVVLVLVLGFFCNHQLAKSVNQMTKICDEAYVAAKREDWQSAQKAITQLEQEWKMDKAWWKTLIDHSEIDNIDQHLWSIRVKVYEHSEEFLSEMAVLTQYFTHAYEKESFSLGNVL